MLNDNGFDADQFANDNVWSTFIKMNDVIGGMTETDVFRPFLGFIAVFENGSQALRGNVFADILVDSIARPVITRIANDAQRTDVLVNIIDPALAQSLENNGLDLPMQRFYQLFGDDYDFINVISSRSFFSNRFHFSVKNDVSGIGRELFNNSFNYGSFGRLQGISMFPLPFFYDGAGEGFQHELAHQWVMYADAAPFGQGAPHWPLSSMAGGMMGWSNPFNGQGQAFHCDVDVNGNEVRLNPRDPQISPVFNDLDLYLMGLLSASEVADNVVFEEQDFQAVISQCDGSLYDGDVIHVSAQDFVNANGPRFPDAAEAQKTFRIATIIVSPDEFVSDDVMALYSYFTRRAESEQEMLVQEGFFKGIGLPFFLSTRGLGRLDMTL
jgi:hypothetical protein